MKTLINIALVVFIFSFVACGPSKEEQAALEKQRIEDSIKRESENQNVIDMANKLFEKPKDTVAKK